MNYRRDNGRRKKRVRFSVLIFAITLLFLEQHRISAALGGGTVSASAPLLQSAATVKNGILNGLLALFSYKQSLIAENNALKEQLREAEAKVLDHDRLLAENTELKTLLGRGGIKEKKILAVILAKPNQSPYDTLILDIGTDNGVNIGNAVLAYGNIVVGEIREVFPKSSRAVLFSSPGEEYQGTLSVNNISLKLTGRGGGNFASELPRGVSVGKGMQIFSVGLSPHILGIVDSIFTDPRNPFQSILVRSPVNIAELKWVEIVL